MIKNLTSGEGSGAKDWIQSYGQWFSKPLLCNKNPNIIFGPKALVGFLVDGQTDMSGRHCPDHKKRTLESSLWTLLYKSLHLAGSDLFRSVQSSVMSNSLWPHGLQHSRLPCPSPLPELTQTHIHRVGDTIQPSHALLSPSPLSFNLPQHQGLFQLVSSSHQVAEVLELPLQHQFFQWICRIAFL